MSRPPRTNACLVIAPLKSSARRMTLYSRLCMHFVLALVLLGLLGCQGTAESGEEQGSGGYGDGSPRPTATRPPAAGTKNAELGTWEGSLFLHAPGAESRALTVADFEAVLAADGTSGGRARWVGAQLGVGLERLRTEATQDMLVEVCIWANVNTPHNVLCLSADVQRVCRVCFRLQPRWCETLRCDELGDWMGGPYNPPSSRLRARYS